MWSPMAGGESPTSRGKHSATLVSGRYLYVLGGRGGNVPLRDLWRYHIEKNCWERIKSSGDTPPACLQEHTAVTKGDKLYVFGGEVAFNNTETPLWVLDTVNHKWRKLPGSLPAQVRSGGGTQSSPRGRRGHTAHVFGDTMLIYGGYQDLKGSSNELWGFHFEREIWQLLNANGPPRHRHAATLFDRRLYIYGGMCDLTERSEMHVFDFMSRKWRQIRFKVGPGPVCGAAYTRIGGRMILVGGESNGRLTDAVWAFHYSTEQWEKVWSGRGGPTPRADGVAIALPRTLLPNRTTQHVSKQDIEDETQSTLLRDIGSNLARLTARPRSKAARCSYTALTPDSNESIPTVPLSTIIKSRSIHGGVARDASPTEGDMVPDRNNDTELSLAKLVYFDSDEDEHYKKKQLTKSASVRFTNVLSSEFSRVECTPSELGFANPNYVTASEAVRQLSTPDSGMESGSSAPVEMKDMQTKKERKPLGEVLLLIGGRETPHALHMSRPLAMWLRDV